MTADLVHPGIFSEWLDDDNLWVASTNTVSFKPIHVTAGYTYVDPHGAAQGDEDVFTRLATARAHYASIGLGLDFIQRLIR